MYSRPLTCQPDLPCLRPSAHLLQCCCSCQQVAVALRTDLPQSLLWCTVYCSDAAGAEGRQRAAVHLAAFLQGQLDTSPLQQQQKQQRGGSSNETSSSGRGVVRGEEGEEGEGSQELDEDEDEEGEGELDEYLQPPSMRRHWQPLLTFVTMPELPRG